MQRGILLAALSTVVQAHDEPTSYLDLTITGASLEVVITASTTDVAHDLSDVEPSMLLDPKVLASQRENLETLLLARLSIRTMTAPLRLNLERLTPQPERRDVQMTLRAVLPADSDTLHVTCQLFPYDPRHRTFVNLHRNGQLQRTEVLNGTETVEFPTGVLQTWWEVFTEFLQQGIHHIFIGPDHILFVVGLLLLGGGVRKLLSIITAFTIAHSITLGLATFNVLTPPARLIEPVIALSIVVVGIHALLGKPHRDPRLWLAFSFGLIHGFGFAFALQEMTLPRQALGWSLFSFNAGVELGQGCIVLLLAPALAWLRQHRPWLSQRVIATCALAVTTAGAFWFFQRLLAPV